MLIGVNLQIYRQPLPKQCVVILKKRTPSIRSKTRTARKTSWIAYQMLPVNDCTLCQSAAWTGYKHTPTRFLTYSSSWLCICIHLPWCELQVSLKTYGFYFTENQLHTAVFHTLLQNCILTLFMGVVMLMSVIAWHSVINWQRFPLSISCLLVSNWRTTPFFMRLLFPIVNQPVRIPVALLSTGMPSNKLLKTLLLIEHIPWVMDQKVLPESKQEPSDSFPAMSKTINSFIMEVSSSMQRENDLSCASFVKQPTVQQ